MKDFGRAHNRSYVKLKIFYSHEDPQSPRREIMLAMQSLSVELFSALTDVNNSIRITEVLFHQ